MLWEILGVIAFVARSLFLLIPCSLSGSPHTLAHEFKPDFGPGPPMPFFQVVELPEDFDFDDLQVQNFRPRVNITKGSPGAVAIEVPFGPPGTPSRKPRPFAGRARQTGPGSPGVAAARRPAVSGSRSPGDSFGPGGSRTFGQGPDVEGSQGRTQLKPRGSGASAGSSLPGQSSRSGTSETINDQQGLSGMVHTEVTGTGPAREAAGVPGVNLGPAENVHGESESEAAEGPGSASGPGTVSGTARHLGPNIPKIDSDSDAGAGTNPVRDTLLHRMKPGPGKHGRGGPGQLEGRGGIDSDPEEERGGVPNGADVSGSSTPDSGTQDGPSDPSMPASPESISQSSGSASIGKNQSQASDQTTAPPDPGLLNATSISTGSTTHPKALVTLNKTHGPGPILDGQEPDAGSDSIIATIPFPIRTSETTAVPAAGQIPESSVGLPAGSVGTGDGIESHLRGRIDLASREDETVGNSVQSSTASSSLEESSPDLHQPTTPSSKRQPGSMQTGIFTATATAPEPAVTSSGELLETDGFNAGVENRTNKPLPILPGVQPFPGKPIGIAQGRQRPLTGINGTPAAPDVPADITPTPDVQVIASRRWSTAQPSSGSASGRPKSTTEAPITVHGGRGMQVLQTAGQSLPSHGRKPSSPDFSEPSGRLPRPGESTRRIAGLDPPKRPTHTGTTQQPFKSEHLPGPSDDKQVSQTQKDKELGHRSGQNGEKPVKPPQLFATGQPSSAESSGEISGSISANGKPRSGSPGSRESGNQTKLPGISRMSSTTTPGEATRPRIPGFSRTTVHPKRTKPEGPPTQRETQRTTSSHHGTDRQSSPGGALGPPSGTSGVTGMAAIDEQLSRRRPNFTGTTVRPRTRKPESLLTRRGNRREPGLDQNTGRGPSQQGTRGTPFRPQTRLPSSRGSVSRPNRLPERLVSPGRVTTIRPASRRTLSFRKTTVSPITTRHGGSSLPKGNRSTSGIQTGTGQNEQKEPGTVLSRQSGLPGSRGLQIPASPGRNIPQAYGSTPENQPRIRDPTKSTGRSATDRGSRRPGFEGRTGSQIPGPQPSSRRRQPDRPIQPQETTQSHGRRVVPATSIGRRQGSAESPGSEARVVPRPPVPQVSPRAPQRGSERRRIPSDTSDRTRQRFGSISSDANRPQISRASATLGTGSDRASTNRGLSRTGLGRSTRPQPALTNTQRRSGTSVPRISGRVAPRPRPSSQSQRVSQTSSIPIDNGVEGDPEINCGPTSITVSFNTQNPFEGNVFVKGLFNDEACRVIGQDNDRTASIELPFETCGVNRQRSLNPRGVFVSVTVIASFHPSFITKVDRAVRAQCFYMEADKTVDTDLEVSELTTGLDDLIDRQVIMPVCRYEILDGGPNGNTLRFALIGQQVYHSWVCDSETTDTFCMVVYDCYVDDTAGDRIQLIDEDGCALDKHILNNIEYPSDLTAGVEAHVFKYADRPSTYYNCQIRIEIKEPGVECSRPNCPEPQSRGGGGGRPRGKRSVDDTRIVDVSIPHSILVGDIDLTEEDVPAALLHPANNRYSNWTPNTVSAFDMEDGVCMSPTGFGILLSIGAIFFMATLFMATFLCMRRSSNKVGVF